MKKSAGIKIFFMQSVNLKGLKADGFAKSSILPASDAPAFAEFFLKTFNVSSKNRPGPWTSLEVAREHSSTL
ncbi:MAG: hypothetical protein K9J79_10060 [Desulfobacteraceae bacterium]|nr:hypothetical protein [Desulfobacteraceae bacterium]